MQIRENNNSNEILIAAAASAIEQMKYEIAQEFGVTLGGFNSKSKWFSRWRNYKTFSSYGARAVIWSI